MEAEVTDVSPAARAAVAEEVFAKTTEAMAEASAGGVEDGGGSGSIFGDAL